MKLLAPVSWCLPLANSATTAAILPAKRIKPLNAPSKTITIDDSNRTLSGIRDAINKANMGRYRYHRERR